MKIIVNIERRLNRLEARHSQSFTDVLSWIRAGRYYDELNDAEKERYCLYRNSDRMGLEQVCGYFVGLHFQLEHNPTPPTPTQHAETVKELEEWFRQAQAEYNAACCE